MTNITEQEKGQGILTTKITNADKVVNVSSNSELSVLPSSLMLEVARGNISGMTFVRRCRTQVV